MYLSAQRAHSGHRERIEAVGLDRVDGHADAACLGVHAEGALQQVVLRLRHIRVQSRVAVREDQLQAPALQLNITDLALARCGLLLWSLLERRSGGGLEVLPALLSGEAVVPVPAIVQLFFHGVIGNGIKDLHVAILARQ